MTPQRRPPRSKWGCLDEPCDMRHDAPSRRESAWQTRHTVEAGVRPRVREKRAPKVYSFVPSVGNELRVTCPTCKAPPRERCTMVSGVAWLKGPIASHPARQARREALAAARAAG